MQLSRETSLRFKRLVRHMKPSHFVTLRIGRKVIEAFAEKVGLVYFGYVDQHDDDHRLIRGHTVSQTHQDNHYCIGTVKGYDVILALRNDVVRLRNGKEQRCHWLIYTIDLHTTREIPHCYIGHQSHKDTYAASFHQLQPLAIGGLGRYTHAFVTNYTIYGAATHAVAIEHMITPQIAEVVATHFQGASIEITDGTVYVYVEQERPTEKRLEAILSSGLWLAEAIDRVYAVPSAE